MRTRLGSSLNEEVILEPSLSVDILVFEIVVVLHKRVVRDVSFAVAVQGLANDISKELADALRDRDTLYVIRRLGSASTGYSSRSLRTARPPSGGVVVIWDLISDLHRIQDMGHVRDEVVVHPSASTYGSKVAVSSESLHETCVHYRL